MSAVGDPWGAYHQTGAQPFVDFNDPAIAAHSIDCGEDDFASPILGLVAEAAAGRKQIAQQNEGVLDIFAKIVRVALNFVPIDQDDVDYDPAPSGPCDCCILL